VSEVQASLARFTRTERWVHRATGLLMGTCLVTAFVLYYFVNWKYLSTVWPLS